MTMYRYAAPLAEREVTRAVRRVVDRYGSDLSAFFRHVEEVAKKSASENTSKESAEKQRDEDQSAA